MKYYGNSSMASFLKQMLNILILAGTIVYGYIFLNTILREGDDILKTTTIITCVLYVAGGFSLLVILVNLRKMVDSLIKVSPFIMANVKSLKNISICSFIISACYIINIFVNGQYKEYKLVVIDAIGIHTNIEFLIFFFAGCFILVLSKVFKQAVEVKEENDFTI